MPELLDKLFSKGIPVKDFSNPIYNLIYERFYKLALEDIEGILLPLPFPTGIGKTYQTNSLIFQILLDGSKKDYDRHLNKRKKGEVGKRIDEEEDPPRICYYITNSVDNVQDAFDSLNQRIDEASELTNAQKTYYKKQLLLAPANSRILLDAMRLYPQEYEEALTKFKIQEDKFLFNELKDIRNLDNLLREMKGNEGIKGTLSRDLEQKASRAYSKLIYKIQAQQRSEDGFFLKDLSRYLQYLVPGILLEPEISQVRVVFMTTKKFLHGLQQSTGKFHPARNLKNQFLMIDEIDLQQGEILDHLVKTNEIDILGMICTIHSNLKQQKLSERKEYEGIAEYFEKYLDDLIYVYEKWALQHSFNLHSSLKDSVEETTVLLFSDKLATHTSSYKEKLVFQQNPETLQHEIGIKGKVHTDEYEFPKFAGALEKLVNQDFFALIHKAEERYRKNVLKYKIPGKIERTSAEITTTILKQFNLYGLKVWLQTQLNFLIGRPKSARNHAGNFHTRGLRIIEVDYLEDAKDSVIFKHHGFDISPTGMIASWVEQGANILGISATAENESVIHNFHTAYLKDSLGSKFVSLSAKDRKLVQDYYDQERNYEAAGVVLSVNAFDRNPKMIKALIAEYLGIPIINDAPYQKFFNIKDNSSPSYLLGELAKICQAIQAFFDEKDNRYMMLMLTKHKYINMSQLDQKGESEFLYWYIQKLSAQYDIEAKAVFGLSAQALKQGRFEEDVIKYLETQKGKLIVFTAYATMSSGKNPDYKFNPLYENNSLRGMGTTYANQRTDIDTLYLQCPSHLISYNDQENRVSNQLRLMSYGLVLQEANFNSPSEIKRWCNQVLTSRSLENTCRVLKNKFYSTKPEDYSEDAISAVFRILEQAIGRSARTANKRHIILLLLDDKLLPILAQDNRKTAILTHEYRAIRDFAKQKCRIIPNLSRSSRKTANQALKNTDRSWQSIERRLIAISNNPDERAIKRWQGLRELALKYPVSLDMPNLAEYYLYSETPGEYHYARGGDGLQIKEYQFFDQVQENRKRYYINESDSRLPILMKNKDIKSYFEKNAYCTAWSQEAHYLLTPPMYVNIYLGALGEAGGMAVLEAQGCQFKELPNAVYEYFDAILTFNGKEALIDFKHWNLPAWRLVNPTKQLETMEGISRKLALFEKGKKLIICNLLSDANTHDSIKFYDDNFNITTAAKGVIIEIPRLIDNLGNLDIDNIKALLIWLQQEAY